MTSLIAGGLTQPTTSTSLNGLLYGVGRLCDWNLIRNRANRATTMKPLGNRIWCRLLEPERNNWVNKKLSLNSILPQSNETD